MRAILERLVEDVIPDLTDSLEKYSEWWTLKEHSPLQEFVATLPENSFNKYFTPEALVSLISHQAFKLRLKTPSNGDIILTENSPLEKCFQSKPIYAPELYNLCLPHINIVTHAKTLEQLKNNAVEEDVLLPCGDGFKYLDPTAQFWIPHDFNQIICNNAKICYSWAELIQMFYHFFTTPSDHVLHCHNNSIFKLNSDSAIANKFKFVYYHRDQITTITQQLSRYLGKTSTIVTVCPKIEFPHCKNTDPIVYWLEKELFGSSDAFPSLTDSSSLRKVFYV